MLPAPPPPPSHPTDIQKESTLHLVLRLRGGKGGFGSLLRGAGKQKLTDNFDACRDLQGVLPLGLCSSSLLSFRWVVRLCCCGTRGWGHSGQPHCTSCMPHVPKQFATASLPPPLPCRPPHPAQDCAAEAGRLAGGGQGAGAGEGGHEAPEGGGAQAAAGGARAGDCRASCGVAWKESLQGIPSRCWAARLDCCRTLHLFHSHCGRAVST